MADLSARRNDILEWMAAQRRPVLASEMEAALNISTWGDAFEGLRRDGVIRAVFPEAMPGDSGRQFWDFAHMTAA